MKGNREDIRKKEKEDSRKMKQRERWSEER